VGVDGRDGGGVRKMSEFIEQCQRLVEEHGDLDVVVTDDSDAYVEFNDDGDDEVFVVS
jgi:hypothetical protein